MHGAACCWKAAADSLTATCMAASQWPRCPERVSAGTGAAIHKPRPRHPALAPRYSCCTPHSLAVLLAAARPMARKHARRQPQASGIRADAGRRRASPGGVPCARFAYMTPLASGDTAKRATQVPAAVVPLLVVGFPLA
jgi:hypothetical protein